MKYRKEKNYYAQNQDKGHLRKILTLAELKKETDNERNRMGTSY